MQNYDFNRHSANEFLVFKWRGASSLGYRRDVLLLPTQLGVAIFHDVI